MNDNPRRTPECLFQNHTLCRGATSGCGCECHEPKEKS